MSDQPSALTLRLDARGLRRLGLGAAAAVVAFVAVTTLGFAVAAYLALCVAAGTGLTYLCGLDLDLEERVAFGAVGGAMAATGLGFLVALVIGFGVLSVALGLLLALAASVPGWMAARPHVRTELVDAGRRWRSGRPWPLWVLLAIAWGFTFAVLSRAYEVTDAGLTVWAIGVYSDWAAHLTYAGSFAYAHNLPPQYPIAPGHRMGYPFMVDFFAASLVPLGSSLTSSLVVSSGYLGLAFPAVMCLAGARLAGSLLASALGVLVLALGGGFGFVGLLADLDRVGGGALQHLPRLYTQDTAQNLQWLNPVLAYFLPQRSVLFGVEVALVVAALLWTARVTGAGWRPYAAAGVLAGVSPAFHVHGFGTAVALGAAWAVIDRRREYLVFLGLALGLGVPIVLWLVQPGASQLAWQPGWMAAADGGHDNWVWFWLKNTGLFIPLLLAAHVVRGALPAGLALRFAPLWLWFLVPNLFVFQPWDWDNTKFFLFWYVFGALLVGALLAHLGRRSLEGAVLAAFLGVILCLSGGLDLARSLDTQQNRALFVDRGGLRVAEWVRGHTPPGAVFAVAPDHNQPVPTLGGRAVLAGYPGWLWTYGLSDWGARVDQEKALLAGHGDPRALGVSYVVIGPQELAVGADAAYWRAHGTVVYESGGYLVVRVD